MYHFPLSIPTNRNPLSPGIGCPIPVLVKALLSHRRAKPAGDGRCGGFCGILFFCHIRTLKLIFAVTLAENGGVTGKIIPSKKQSADSCDGIGAFKEDTWLLTAAF